MLWGLARTLVLLAGLVWVALALLLGGVGLSTAVDAELDGFSARARYGIASAALVLAIFLLCPPAVVARGVGRYLAAICFGLWLAVPPIVALSDEFEVVFYVMVVVPPIVLAAAMIVWARFARLRAEQAGT